MSKDQEQKEKLAAEKEKVVTKYDRKMQKRQQEKEQEAREKRAFTTISVVVLLALICLVLSFPIRTLINLRRPFINVGGEDITRVEFDYSYNTVVNNYVSTYSSYLSLFGLDVTKDLSTQYYSGTLTWQDYFQEMAVDAIKRSKALKADAQANGFTYDTTQEYNTFVEQTKSGAEASGLSHSKYVKQAFGEYATLSRIKPYVEEAMFVNAYYDKLTADMTPTAEEVEAVYKEDPDTYDSVDYRILSFNAELPTEPTELADPVDETAETDENATYTPSEAEVEKAMQDAKAKAEEALTTVKTEGELVDSMLKTYTNTAIADWLFDSARKSGDTAVLEDAGNNCYYTVAFEKRYLDETPTADLRVLIGDDEEQALGMYGEWNSGEATEASFIELCNGKYRNNSVAEDGLVKGLAQSEDIYPELIDWVFTEDRKAGDCGVVTIDEATSLVVYYIGEGNAAWYSNIESNLTNEAVNDYVNALKENCEVQDPSGNLNYLAVRASEEAASKAAEEAENADSAEATENVEGAE